MEHCNCALVGFGKVGELEFCTSITDSFKEFYCAVLKGDWQILSWLLILKSDSIDRTSHMACRNTVAKLIAESHAFSVVGGGDTVAAIESLGISDQFGFLSTAGGAMLEFLEKGTLPGIEVLQQR